VLNQDTRILSALERIGVVCAWIAPLLGLFVLVGYALGVEAMTRLFTGVFMTPNAAVMLTCLGFGILLRLDSFRSDQHRIVSTVLLTIAGLISSIVLLEYVFDHNFGIDMLLFPAMSEKLFAEMGMIHPGRFALSTAISGTCLAIAALGVDARTLRERRVSLGLALVGILISGFMLTAYLYDSEVPPELIRHFAIMAPPTAFALLTLGLSILLARPRASDTGLLASHSLGGVMLWRLLPVGLLFPLLLGAFSMLALRLGWYEPGYGSAVVTTTLAAVFSFVIWWTAYHLDRLDSAARQQSAALAESEARYKNILETANEGIWILDLSAKTSYVNPRLQELLGYSAGEMLGRPLYDFVAATYRPEAEGHFASRVEGKVESYDFQFQRKDGSTLWAIVNSTPLQDAEGHFSGVLKMVSDITERKQAEDELLRTTEALEHAQAVAHIGSWEWDVAADKITWSTELYRIFGLEPRSFSATFQSYLTYLHPDDRELALGIIGGAFENCAPFHFEHRLLRPNGELRYVDSYGECLTDDEGKLVLMRGTAQDITERKRAELNMREAQEHFQSLLNNAGMPISVKDLRGRYLIANTDLAEALGIADVSDILGKRDSELLPPEIAARMELTDLSTMQSEEATAVEEEYPGTDDSRYFWTTKFPMRDAHGTVVGVGVISQEITELRRAEQALRESELRNRSILDAALDAVVSMDERGRVTSWNKQAEVLFGWTVEEALGQQMTMIIPERYRAEHQNGMERYRRTGEAPVLGTVLQVEALHRSGREFPIDLAIGRAVTKTGDVVFSAFIRDVTERKRAEREIQESNLQLEQLNSEMQIALQELANSHQLLQDQAAALERSNTDLDDFAYIASHDLKEPLRGISNYANFLKEDYAEKLDDEGRRMLDTLPRLTKRLETLLDALLKYSRLNRAEIVPLQVDLDTVVEDVKEMLDARIKDNNAQIRVPRPLPTIMCDRSQTTEIFLNLISNGIKYNDEPVKLVEIGYLLESELDPELPPANPVSGAPGDQPSQRELIFYISDNGIGIADKFQETIFGAFRRLHARDKYGGGTGVGLAIVKKMVERQGGRIWVESEPGQGSTFYFTLNPEVTAPGPREA
jgi:PAS domain S-box-containing protein